VTGAVRDKETTEGVTRKGVEAYLKKESMDVYQWLDKKEQENLNLIYFIAT
jgi:hypothetical protein